MAGRKYSNQTGERKPFDWGHAGRVIGYTFTSPFITVKDAITDGPVKAMREDAKRKEEASKPSKGYQD